MSRTVSILTIAVTLVLLVAVGGTLISMAESEPQADRATFADVGTAFT